MAASLNKVMLIGRLGADPKLSYTPSGSAVVNFNMATDEGYKDRQSGQWVNRAEWHRIVVWNQPAEYCANYLTKGDLVYIEGRLQTRKWQDNQGQDKYTTEIVASRVQGMSGRTDDAQNQPQQAPQSQNRQNPN